LSPIDWFIKLWKKDHLLTDIFEIRERMCEGGLLLLMVMGKGVGRINVGP
jgi:hypothetical protein